MQFRTSERGHCPLELVRRCPNATSGETGTGNGHADASHQAIFFFSLVLSRVEQRRGGACHAIGKRVENDRTRVEIGTVDEIGWKTMIEIIKITLYMYLYNTSLCIRNVNVHFSGSL